MPFLPIGPSRIASLALLAILCLALRSDGDSSSPSTLSIRMRTLPHKVLWTWERSEDLRAIDPRTTAVAYLDQTILITRDRGAMRVESNPRRQPLALPSSAQKIAVVRVEVTPGTSLSSSNLDNSTADALRQQAIAQLLHSANRPGISALQVDFDATRSQRTFYARLLRNLRAQMPSDLPLSITALASWCSYDDWLRGLPINEAVPMMFRMEPDRRRLRADRPELQIQEPLCTASVGISTREAWPSNMDLASKRIYIFPDRGWTLDTPLLAERNLP